MEEKRSEKGLIVPFLLVDVLSLLVLPLLLVLWWC